MKRVLNHFSPSQSNNIVFCDNLSVIKLSKNPVLHGEQTYRCEVSFSV